MVTTSMVKVHTCEKAMDGFNSLRVDFTSPGGATSIHTIYCKLHRVRQNSDTTPNDRTLFTVGWPPYCTKELIGELFSRAGNVENTFLQLNPGTVDARITADSARNLRGFQIGYVVMSSIDEATSAIHLCQPDTALPCQLTSVGLKKWSLQYTQERLNMTLLERTAVSVVSSYDLRQNVERLKEKRAGEPDEEGWITVTRKRRAVQTQDGNKGRKKRKKELVNLYPWQQRETQRQQIAELRQKFEEDKRRVEEMKSRRKFKPF